MIQYVYNVYIGFQLDVNKHLMQCSGIDKAKEKDKYVVADYSNQISLSMTDWGSLRSPLK